MRKLSLRQTVILGGALVAALAGLGAGAAARPAGPPAGGTLGPRMDFDLAAHALPPSVGPPRTLLAARGSGGPDG